MATKVIFRKFRNTNEIIAIFPDESYKGNYKTLCYCQESQHFEADYFELIKQTTLASPSEYEDILNELKYIGYKDLTICKRAKLEYKQITNNLK